MESRTICQWCASATDSVFRCIVFSCFKIGKVVRKLYTKEPSGLPKIDIEEPPASPKEKKAVTSAKKTRKITFRYHNPSATNVKLVGDFSKWEPVSMRKNGTGGWKTTVELIPEKYTYKFVVDGEWIKDPKNTETRADNYGSESSVIEVTKPKR